MLKLFDRFTTAVLNMVDPYTPGSTAPASTVWAYLRANLRPMRPVLILSLCFTVFTASVEVWLISYAGKLIDTLADTPPADIWSVHGWNLLGAAAIVLLLRPMAQCVRHAMNDIGVQCNVANLYRWRAHEHLANQSVGWFQDDLTGRTSTRLVDVGNHASNAIFHVLNAVAFGAVYMVGIVGLMASTDPRLALPLFIWLALYVGIMAMIVPRMVRAQEAFQGAKSALIGTVVDSFSNFDTLKLFARRDAIAADHKSVLENTRQKLFHARQIAVAMRTTIILLEGLIMVGFIGYGIWMWSEGIATIGLVGSAIALTLRITTMADWIMDAVWSIFLTVGSMREALKTLSQPIAIPVVDGLPDLQVGAGDITISGLTHQYGAERGGLDGLTLNIRPGEKVGIVGRSGAGKSTLVNLILRFFEAEHGSIRINGQDIRDVDQDSLRAAIGMVSQQASLLNRSVRDNIALGREGATLDDIIAAAREARADEFIVGLQDNKGRKGYDAHVGERGVKLSGGQRQRIALARVILKGAPILILDEATSALDSEVEAEIQASLQNVMRDKTVIAIAHRLSTISQMDRIIVLDDGALVEQGSHEDLLARDGLYALFWGRQSGGFIGADTGAAPDGSL